MKSRTILIAVSALVALALAGIVAFELSTGRLRQALGGSEPDRLAFVGSLKLL